MSHAIVSLGVKKRGANKKKTVQVVTTQKFNRAHSLAEVFPLYNLFFRFFVFLRFGLGLGIRLFDVFVLVLVLALFGLGVFVAALFLLGGSFFGRIAFLRIALLGFLRFLGVLFGVFLAIFLGLVAIFGLFGGILMAAKMFTLFLKKNSKKQTLTLAGLSCVRSTT